VQSRFLAVGCGSSRSTRSSSERPCGHGGSRSTTACGREIADRLAVLGYGRLEDWAGAANLEERFEGEDRIDPVVLDALRRASN